MRANANKLLILSALALGLGPQCLAQTEFYVSSNDTVSLTAGSTLYVDGDIQLATGSILRNRGTVRLTRSWNATGRYVWDRLPTPADSLIVLAAYANPTFTSTNDSIGILSLQSQVAPFVDMAGTAVALHRLHFSQGLWLTDALSNLRLGPRAEAEGFRFDRFVNGPLELANGPGSATARLLPIGKDTVYRPLTFFDIQNATASLTRAELFNADPTATGAPGQRFQRLSQQRYFRVDVPVGSLGTNVEVRTPWGPTDNYTVAEFSFLRLGIRQDPSSVGDYDTLRTVNRTGVAAAGALRSAAPSFGPTNYLVLGINKLEAGTLIAAPANINIGDTAQMQIAGADLGPDITRQIFRSQDGGAFNPLTSIGGNQTAFNSDTVFRPTLFRSIATAGPNFEPDTTNDDGPILNSHVTLDLRVLLQGPYQSPGVMVSGYIPDTLRSYFTTRADPDSNMYANFGTNTFSVPTGAIDVVALELRTGTAAATTVPGSSKLAWLMSDGSLRDFRTASAAHPVMYFNVAPGNYYVVVRHRNHLPMMSSVPVAFVGPGPTSYDMTRIASVYAMNSAVQRGGFVFPADARIAAFLGNVGTTPGEPIQHVNAFDFFLVYVDHALALSGYLQTDVNLDGVVNALDYQRVQLNNDRLYYSNVPE